MTMTRGRPRKHRAPSSEMKTCNDCSKLKAHSEFYKRAASPDGLQNRCAECSSRRQLEYLENSRNGISNSIIVHLFKEPKSDYELLLDNERAYRKRHEKRCQKCRGKMRYRSVLKVCERCHQKMKGD